jgi:CAAX protease family protein
MKQMEKAVVVFLMFVFLWAYSVSLFVQIIKAQSSPSGLALGLSCMAAPCVAALLVHLSFREGLLSGSFKRFQPAYAALAVLVPVAVVHVACLGFIYLAIGKIPWVAWLTPDSTGLIVPPTGAPLRSPFLRAQLATTLASKLFGGLILATIFALGEETGWRGFLQPRLERRFGTRRGIALLSAIWAVWHLGFELSGLHYPQYPIWARVLGGTVSLWGVGMFLGWLFSRTGSVWVVALAHGAMNNWSQFALRFVDLEPKQEFELLFVMAAALFLMGSCFWSRLRQSALALDPL